MCTQICPLAKQFQVSQKVPHLKINSKRNKVDYLKSKMLFAAKATDTVQDATLIVISQHEQQSVKINALEMYQRKVR